MDDVRDEFPLENESLSYDLRNKYKAIGQSGKNSQMLSVGNPPWWALIMIEM